MAREQAGAAAAGSSPGVRIERVEPGSSEYAEAAEVRYASLYEPYGLGRELIADTDGRTYVHVVAVHDAVVVGYARLLLEDAGEGVIEPGEAKAFQVCVAPGMRARGTGRRLMCELETLARAAGRRAVILDARDYAVGFYERLGYVVEGEAFLSPRTGTPHVRMRRMLSSGPA